MNHFKHLLFLSILCSLVLFTNCGEDEDEKKCVTCTNRSIGAGVEEIPFGCIGDENEYGDINDPDRNTYYTEADLQYWVDKEGYDIYECYWD